MRLEEFVLARLAEDEQVALAALRQADFEAITDQAADGARMSVDRSALSEATLVAIGPRRALRVVEAHRQIVGVFLDVLRSRGEQSARELEWAPRALAAAYSDHPDYDPTWRG